MEKKIEALYEPPAERPLLQTGVHLGRRQFPSRDLRQQKCPRWPSKSVSRAVLGCLDLWGSSFKCPGTRYQHPGCSHNFWRGDPQLLFLGISAYRRPTSRALQDYFVFFDREAGREGGHGEREGES